MTGESDPYSTRGRLTVARDLHDGTSLVEVWAFESLLWTEENAGTYDVVKCYIVDLADLNAFRLPPSEKRVTASCSWEDVPLDVRAEFRSQVGRLTDAVNALDAHDSPALEGGGDA